MQLEEIQKAIDAEESDLFDVLAYIAYALPRRTRLERAEQARARLDGYNPKLKSFLDFVLSHYVAGGVDELDVKKLAPLLRLKYHNSIADALKDLGTDATVRQAFINFQQHLYLDTPAASQVHG
jgi:type I restriction enzyme R subunit